MSALPAAAVILASRNRPALLADAVASILAGEQVPAELIVVDQSDRPDLGLRGRAPGGACRLRYLWSESRGLSRANNLGAAAAGTDLLVFTHDDVVVDPGWYGSLLAALVSAGPRAVVTGRVLAAAPPSPGGFAPSTNPDPEPAAWQGRIGRDVLFPMNMALHRRALAGIGGFDERLGPGTPYPAAEDNDLGYRLLEAGYRIVYEPGAVVHHRAWRPDAEYADLRYGYGRGQGAFYAKHLGWRNRDMLRRLAGDVVGRLARLPARAVMHGRRVSHDLPYVRGVLAGLVDWRRAYGSAPARPGAGGDDR
jgi:GT2 family glycosyltransferase